MDYVDYQIFFSRIMMIKFRPLVEARKCITYLDDLLLMADTEDEMFENIIEFHRLLRESGLKASAEKTELFRKEVQYLGHYISGKGIRPLNKT